MKILAIETSTMLGGVAVMDSASGLVSEVRLNVKSTHSEKLMTAVDQCLSMSGLSASDMDVFAVSSGPGSFTGLRIGLSTVKGFSYATGKPVVTVPTLEAFAWNFAFSSLPVCLMLDARKGEVYSALFRWNGSEFDRLMPEASIKASDLCRTLEGEVLFAGEGALLYGDVIREILGGSMKMPPPEKMVPSPANVAALGLRKALSGDFADPASAAPFYVRRSEAEVKWSGKA